MTDVRAFAIDVAADVPEAVQRAFEWPIDLGFLFEPAGIVGTLERRLNPFLSEAGAPTDPELYGFTKTGDGAWVLEQDDEFDSLEPGGMDFDPVELVYELRGDRERWTMFVRCSGVAGGQMYTVFGGHREGAINLYGMPPRDPVVILRTELLALCDEVGSEIGTDKPDLLARVAQAREVAESFFAWE